MRVHVDPLAFLEWERGYLGWYDWVLRQLTLQSKPYLEIRYEEMAHDTESVLARIQRHIGSHVLPLKALQKLGGASVARYIKQSDARSVETRILKL